MEAIVSSGLDQDIDDVDRNVKQAREALKRADWLRAAQALLEVQDRVGRLLREIDLKRTALPSGRSR